MINKMCSDLNVNVLLIICCTFCFHCAKSSFWHWKDITSMFQMCTETVRCTNMILFQNGCVCACNMLCLLLLSGHGLAQHGVRHSVSPVFWYRYSRWWMKSHITTSLALNRSLCSHITSEFEFLLCWSFQCFDPVDTWLVSVPALATLSE